MQNRYFWDIQVPRLHSSLAKCDEIVISVFSHWCFTPQLNGWTVRKGVFLAQKTLVCDLNVAHIEAWKPPTSPPDFA